MTLPMEHYDRRVGRLHLSRLWAIAICLTLLAGVATQRILGPSRDDAEPYLQRVRVTAADTPLQFGTWVGTEQPVPPSAVALLRPNVLMSRSYTEISTGQQAGWLFVDCGDARDLSGHYPPICYVNSGWLLSDARQRDWRVDNWIVRGTEYEFSTQPLRGRRGVIVMDTMVMPDGQFHPDMDSVRRAAARLTRRYWGAAQIQVVVDGSMPQTTRDEIFVALMSSHARLIASVLDSQATDRPALATDGPTLATMPPDSGRELVP